MGMDLIPAKSGDGLHYNWSGWELLIKYLKQWKVDVSEFKFINDGDHISAKTCRKVAAAIELHLAELSPEQREWLQPHIAAWRTCGGFNQH